MKPETRGKYRIGTVARMTGFSVDVLRAWERRHGLFAPERGPGGQRLYTDEDLVVLRAVERELRRGRPIGEIALDGRDALLRGEGEARTEADAKAESAAGIVEDSGGGGAAGTGTAGEGTGRDAHSRHFLDIARRSIVDAAIGIDGERIEELLDVAFRAAPEETIVLRVIEPAAHEIGEAWAAGRCSVAGEHLASALFTRRLAGMIRERNGSEASDRSRAICACFPDELHELPALIVAYHLSRLGLRLTYLGPSLPFEDLEAAIRALRPQTVYLSVSRRAVIEMYKPRLLELLERHSPDVAFVIGGRGVTGHDGDLERSGVLIWPDGRPASDLGPSLGATRVDASTRRRGRRHERPGGGR